MGMSPAHRTSLPTGFSEWGLGHISHAWNDSPWENLSVGVDPIVTEQGRGWFTINYYRKDSPFLSLEVPSPPNAPLLGSQCPPPEERRLSMPETGEKERNCLFKSYTDLE